MARTNIGTGLNRKLGAGTLIFICLLALSFQGGMAVDHPASKSDLKKADGPPLLPVKQSESPSKPVESKPLAPVKKSEAPLKKPLYFQVGQLLLNLKEEEKTRYLKIRIQFLMSEPDAIEYLNKRIAQVKDITRGELENYSARDLQQAEQREDIKQQILTKVSQLFPKKKEKRKWKDPQPIKKVLFEEMVIQ